MPPYHRLFPPPCFTVDNVVRSEMDSPLFSRHTPFHLIQSYLSWFHLTTRLFYNHLLSSFYAVEQILATSEDESSSTWVLSSLWQTVNHSPEVPFWLFVDRQGVEGGGLNSSIQPSSLNLINNGGFIMSRKLERMSTMIVFPVCMHSLLDSIHNRLSRTSSLLNISSRISLFKQKITEVQLAAEVAFMVVVRGWVEFQHAKVIQIRSHDIVHCFHSIILAEKVEKHEK